MRTYVYMKVTKIVRPKILNLNWNAWPTFDPYPGREQNQEFDSQACHDLVMNELSGGLRLKFVIFLPSSGQISAKILQSRQAEEIDFYCPLLLH